MNLRFEMICSSDPALLFVVKLSNFVQQLKIRYLCMGKMHEVTVDDEAQVRLPMRAHLLTQ